MWYEINVALKGKHFFATDKRSITDRQQLKQVYTAFAAKFPESEGYTMNVTSYATSGYTVDPMTGERPRQTMGEMEAENPDVFKNPE